MDEVIINGRRYVPSPSEADTVKFYFMHDWHGFSRLRGAALDEVVAHADQIEASAVGSYGMLCPAILMSGEKEVRRAGPSAHARGTKDPKDHWNEEKANLRFAMRTGSSKPKHAARVTVYCEANTSAAGADFARILSVARTMISNAEITGSPKASPG